MERIQSLLIELHSQIAHELSNTKQHNKTRETYEYIIQKLNQSLKGVKGFKPYSEENAINQAFLASNIYNNGGWYSPGRNEPREFPDSHFQNQKEPITTRSDDDIESERSNRTLDKKKEKEGVVAINSAQDDEKGKQPPTKEGAEKMLGKIVNMFESVKRQSAVAAARRTAEFQLRIDNAIVMRMTSDQLMQVYQLQSRLNNCSSLEEAQRILGFSAFYKNLPLSDKVVFRGGNPTYFKPLSTKLAEIMAFFVEKIANNDPSTDFRRPYGWSNEVILNKKKIEKIQNGFLAIVNKALEEKGIKGQQEQLGNTQSPEKNLSTDDANAIGHPHANESGKPEDNSESITEGTEQLGKFKLQRQILQNVKVNSLFKGGLQSLKAKLSESGESTT